MKNYLIGVILRSKRSLTRATKFGPREGVFAFGPRESKKVEGGGGGGGERREPPTSFHLFALAPFFVRPEFRSFCTGTLATQAKLESMGAGDGFVVVMEHFVLGQGQ